MNQASFELRLTKYPKLFNYYFEVGDPHVFAKSIGYTRGIHVIHWGEFWNHIAKNEKFHNLWRL